MRLWIALLSGATLVNVVLTTAIPAIPVEAAAVKTDQAGDIISESGLNENEVATGSETGSLATATDEERSSGDGQECGGNLDCEEQKLVAMVDKADSRDSIPVIPGLVTLDRKAGDNKDGDGRETAAEEGSQDIEVRLDRYLRSHDLSLHVWGTKFQVGLDRFSRGTGDVAEGRGRLRKLLIPMLLLKDVPLGVLFLVFSSAVVLISFHALWAGLASLMVSGWVGLKLLLQQDHPPSPRVSVGVVRAPLPLDVVHHDYLHHGHGWSRAGAAPAAAPLVDPYRAYYQRGALERDYLDRPMRR